MTPGNPDAFLDDLRAEVAAFRQFVDLLRSEQAVLAQMDVEPLLELARRKSQAVVTLTQLAERRRRFLSSRGLDPMREAPGSWTPYLDAERSQVAARHWRELLDLAQTARRLNDANGAMVQTKMRYNREALAVLQVARGQLDLYGPDGRTAAAHFGRPLAKI
ncbi:MAG: flagellar protein FlgN [Betaproteobacteria bacterium]|nr:flagellar protein FlgN [Betaproteobacteria bacterium]